MQERTGCVNYEQKTNKRNYTGLCPYIMCTEDSRCEICLEVIAGGKVITSSTGL